MFVIKTKNGRYLTTKYGYSKDINKARVYEHGVYWNVGPKEKIVEVKRYTIEQELEKR